ncbi:MAG: glycosyltransferase family protein [Desulfovibrionaceae bacterium]|nr:glycosyltransferase family protein [Desulfovibrionaceae bacterium]
MARILYGIHGTGHGHAMRGLTIARRLKQHQFLFVCADDAVPVLSPEFPVHQIPNLGTVFKDYKVDFGATIRHSIPLLKNSEKYIRELTDLIHAFGPDVCMTDLEYFVPRAAERAEIPCLSLGHQHVITCCRHSNLPGNMWWDTWLQGMTPKYLFRPTDENLIVSFYQPPVLPRYRARVVPPILRDQVLAATPSDEGHVVVYQSNSTSPELIDFLKKATKRRCYVFGYRMEEGEDGNVVYMKKSEEGFLKLLAGCSYVIQGGSHTLMTEALHLGKPIFTIPLKAMVEQRFNAWYIERLNYGMQADMEKLNPMDLLRFEARLDDYRREIAKGRFCGNEIVFGLVDTFIRTKRLPETGEPPVLETKEKRGPMKLAAPEDMCWEEASAAVDPRRKKRASRRTGA